MHKTGRGNPGERLQTGLWATSKPCRTTNDLDDPPLTWAFTESCLAPLFPPPLKLDVSGDPTDDEKDAKRIQKIPITGRSRTIRAELVPVSLVFSTCLARAWADAERLPLSPVTPGAVAQHRLKGWPGARKATCPRVRARGQRTLQGQSRSQPAAAAAQARTGRCFWEAQRPPPGSSGARSPRRPASMSPRPEAQRRFLLAPRGAHAGPAAPCARPSPASRRRPVAGRLTCRRPAAAHLASQRPPSTPRVLTTGRERGRAAEHHGIKEDPTPRPTAQEVTGPEVGGRRERRKTQGRAAFRRPLGDSFSAAPGERREGRLT